ncbi:hypothetical protein AU106_gp009 [Sinorhizobium phage phiM9]|uniref:Uncharacterized protein n=1 Tax=Sinorhizobium phage phiM9 TaxID=1636182 RepID=A0A0F6R5Q0_9CAUD|nr:hypothetical protein AU106_gp009 [Sinorhizobium phage phiM9]AKE44640.1 hypothetical protein Sm_phiM9_010 [Sinorhizobium phage phiM9]
MTAQTNEVLGHQLTEFYMISRTGYKTLIGVSKGFDGGFTFNIGSMDCGPVLKEVHRKIQGRLFNGGRLVDSENNEMYIQELFDFAAYSRGRKPVEGSESKIVTDSHGFMFGTYKPKFLHRVN